VGVKTEACDVVICTDEKYNVYGWIRGWGFGVVGMSFIRVVYAGKPSQTDNTY